MVSAEALSACRRFQERGVSGQMFAAENVSSAETFFVDIFLSSKPLFCGGGFGGGVSNGGMVDGDGPGGGVVVVGVFTAQQQQQEVHRVSPRLAVRPPRFR